MKKETFKVNKEYRNSNVPEFDDFNKKFQNFADKKKIQNAGGFRFKSKVAGPTNIEESSFVLLVTNFGEEDWPDRFDAEKMEFIYYGDNRKPGHDILDTHIGGNRYLKSVQEKLEKGELYQLNPILAFANIKKGRNSYMKFLGLVVPKTDGSFLTIEARHTDKGSFANYKSNFKVLSVDEIDFEWLQDSVNGILPYESGHCPEVWKEYVERYSDKALKEIAVENDNGEQDIDILKSLNPKEIALVEVDKNIKTKTTGNSKARGRANTDYEATGRVKKFIGDSGEAVVFESEKNRLIKLGYPELAAKVEWTSKVERDLTKGDSAGFDVRSFEIIDFDKRAYKEKYIEVKTTSGNINEPFYLTKNELEVCKNNQDKYCIYRLGNFDGKSYEFYVIKPGELLQFFELVPTEYMVYGRE